MIHTVGRNPGAVLCMKVDNSLAAATTSTWNSTYRAVAGTLPVHTCSFVRILLHSTLFALGVYSSGESDYELHMYSKTSSTLHSSMGHGHDETIMLYIQ